MILIAYVKYLISVYKKNRQISNYHAYMSREYGYTTKDPIAQYVSYLSPIQFFEQQRWIAVAKKEKERMARQYRQQYNARHAFKYEQHMSRTK